MKRSVVLTVFLCSIISVFAQVDLESIAKSELAAYTSLQTYNGKRSSGGNIDIVYASLELTPNMKTAYLRGNVLYYFKTTGPVNQIIMDLRTELKADSVLFRGTKQNFTHSSSHLLTINLNQTVTTGSLDSIRIFYQGTPDQANRAYTRNVTLSGNVIATLSEPYGAHYWWPCRENLSDKIDSLDVRITVDTMYKAASNGLLQSVVINDSMHTWHWKHRYPIATYLVAFSASRYSIYSDFALLKNGKNLEILNYVFPHSEADARIKTKATVPVMQLFDSLFGPYPFYKEKYGHAQFTAGGGMEHQTMSFMGNFGYDLIAHELAHQWFGDKITCGSWQDLWLNESFATYCNLLCYDFLKTEPEWIDQLKKFKNDVLSKTDGSVIAKDTNNVSALFEYRTTYQKGAMALHQLRWVVGDQAFFAGLRNYLADPGLGYNFASAKDLRFYMEQASGMNLGDYFNDWFVGEGYPTYNLKWKQKGTSVTIDVIQTSSHPSVELYNVPLPVLLRGANKDSLVVIPVNKAVETFTIDLPFKMRELVFDPQEWILGKHNIQFELSESKGVFSIYPNPIQDYIYIALQDSDLDDVKLFDACGKLVWSKKYTTPLLKGAIETIDLSGVSAGIYILQLKSQDTFQTQKLIIQHP